MDRQELTSLKCPYYPKQPMIQSNSYQDPNDVFHRTRTNISKNYMKTQEAPHSNSDPEKQEQSWGNRAN